VLPLWLAPRAGESIVKEPCCLCDNTHAHTRLCGSCARDPANADWVQGEEETLAHLDVSDTDRMRFGTLAEATDLPLRCSTDLQRRIETIMARGLSEQVIYRRPGKHYPVRSPRWRAARSWAEVGRAAGCSAAYARRIALRRIDG
jgi:hypothetical protein